MEEKYSIRDALMAVGDAESVTDEYHGEMQKLCLVMWKNWGKENAIYVSDKSNPYGMSELVVDKETENEYICGDRVIKKHDRSIVVFRSPADAKKWTVEMGILSITKLHIESIRIGKIIAEIISWKATSEYPDERSLEEERSNGI